MKAVFAAVLGITILLAGTSSAQDEISEISFDSIPEGHVLNGGDAAIELQSDTNVIGAVNATGQVASDVGFKFPDGTVQTTATFGSAEPNIGLTANQGLYNNRIANFTPPNAYTEICIKGGAVAVDIHAVSEPTTGGNCLPSDVGWIIERFEREGGATITWPAAKLDCLKDGMRLPEAFEWSIACINAITYGLNDMEDDWEWASNETEANSGGAALSLVTAPVMGLGSCTHGIQGTIANASGDSAIHEYRCVL